MLRKFANNTWEVLRYSPESCLILHNREYKLHENPYADKIIELLKNVNFIGMNVLPVRFEKFEISDHVVKPAV